MKTLLRSLFLFMALFVGKAHAQLDTDHWIPALWASESTNTSVGTHWLTLTTPSTSNVNVTVKDGNGTVYFNGVVKNSAPVQLTLGTLVGTTWTPSASPAGQLGHLVFGLSGFNAKVKQGLIVEASAPVYANVRTISTSQGDSLTGKGKKALGLEFRVGVMQNARSANSYRGIFTCFMATQIGNTVVTVDQIKAGVQFSGRAVVGGKSDDFSVTLAQYESYCFGIKDTDTGSTTTNVNDMNGTRIRADKPITVNCGSWLGGQGAATGQDVGIDQIAPVNLAGSEYVLMKGGATNGDLKEGALVVATQANTQVFVNGASTAVATLVNPGDYTYQIGIYPNGQNAYLTTSKPTLVWQHIGGSDSDATPGYNFIPPLGADSATSVDNIYQVEQLGTATVAVAARSGATVLMNGAAIGVAPVALSGTSDWVTYRKLNVTGNVSVTSTGAVAVAVFNVNGAIGAAGYFSGFPPTLVDLDFDGIPDGSDNCPEVNNTTQADGDGDHVGDACDGCPTDGAKTAPGICGCGRVDSTADINGNGTLDCLETDFCPTDPLKLSPGQCGCGVPDTNSDGDSLADCLDGCDNNPAKLDPGQCGCSVADTDTDFDGSADCIDQCDNDNTKTVPGACGCGVPDTNSDGDAQADCNETCDNDPNKLAPGICGCGVADTNSDGDAQADCNETCDNDPNKLAPGICGCGVADVNADGDSKYACQGDLCDNDPSKLAPGVCGCGVADVNADGDALYACQGDLCDNDPSKLAPGACGCGIPDIDVDHDGVYTCQGDVCDNDPAKTTGGVCGCGIPDIDVDHDGVYTCQGDVCDSDPTKTTGGVCGCGIADVDADHDGVYTCQGDACDADPNKSTAGICGCGVTDADSDSDGRVFCLDNCPAVANADQDDCDGDSIGDACDNTAECCADGVVNADESDTDCGGACAGCDYGEQCNVASDCASGVCAGTCACASDDDCPNADDTCSPDRCNDGVCEADAPICNVPVFYGVVTDGIALKSIRCWQTSPTSAPTCEMNGGVLVLGEPMCGN